MPRASMPVHTLQGWECDGHLAGWGYVLWCVPFDSLFLEVLCLDAICRVYLIASVASTLASSVATTLATSVAIVVAWVARRRRRHQLSGRRRWVAPASTKEAPAVISVKPVVC